MEGDEIGRHQGACDPRRAARLAFRRRQIAGHGIRRFDYRRGGRAPGADPGKSGAARGIQGHEFPVRRRADDHAGRSRAGASSRLFGDPFRARRRGRLYRGRGREGFHVARRFRHHCELGAARSRQSVGQADAVARRARLPRRQFLRNFVRRAFRRPDAGDHARRRQFTCPSTARACCPTARRR